MKALIAFAFVGAAVAPPAAFAQGNDRVSFPNDYKAWIHYSTVERGGIREELYTSRESIEAAKKGLPMPDGTIILMEDYRDGRLFRYVAMEKRLGWGERHQEDIRNGDWEFQSFAPDHTVNRSENVMRCMSCHKGQADTDYLFTRERMRAAK